MLAISLTLDVLMYTFASVDIFGHPAKFTIWVYLYVVIRVSYSFLKYVSLGVYYIASYITTQNCIDCWSVPVKNIKCPESDIV